MMLKFQLTKDEFAALTDEQKAMYGEAGDGYQMKIEGLPDVTGLKTKVEELLNEKKTEKEKRELAEAEAQRLALEQARKKGDVETLENSWKQKLADNESQFNGKIETLQKSLHNLLVENVAQKLATELAGDAAPVMLPHIKSRLLVEEQDGKHITRIVDGEGKPSAASIDDLKKEFTNNKAFATVVIGSRANGTGGNGGKQPVGDGGKKWSDYSEAERIRLLDENPEEFKRLAATQ